VGVALELDAVVPVGGVVSAYGYGVELENVDHHPASAPGCDVAGTIEARGLLPGLLSWAVAVGASEVWIVVFFFFFVIVVVIVVDDDDDFVMPGGPESGPLAEVRYPYPKKPLGPNTIDIVPGLWPVDSSTEEGTNPPTPTRPLFLFQRGLCQREIGTKWERGRVWICSISGN